LCLPVDDPVWIVYNEQKGYFNEPNWYNEVTELLKKYDIEESEEDIRSLSKASWKEIVKRAVRKHTSVTLYEECQSKSKTSNVPPYTELQQQKYFGTLNPSRARVYFQVRAGVYDVKANRKYSDQVCRLCEQAVETIEHILNECTKVCRSDGYIEDVYDQSAENITTILSRVEHFELSVAERGTGSRKSTRKS
jgi:hypothetical protein